MISKLKGLVDEIGETWVDLNVHGICYRLSCSAKTLASLPSPGSAVTLFTKMLVREDDISLLGFETSQERALFELLTSVQGVGTRVGLALFSIGPADDIIFALQNEDKAFICRADGVGPKLAGRLVNELKDKIKNSFTSSPSTMASSPSSSADTNVFPLPSASFHQDAVAALVSLGYRSNEASLAVDYVMKNEVVQDNVQDLIRLSLSKLSRS